MRFGPYDWLDGVCQLLAIPLVGKVAGRSRQKVHGLGLVRFGNAANLRASRVSHAWHEYRREAQLDVQLGEAADLIDAGAVVQAVQQGTREVDVLRHDVPLTECVGVGVQQPLRGERASVSPAVYVVTVCVCVYVRPERDVRYCWYWGLEQRWQSVAMAHWRRSL